jgi:HEAT repeat protein
VKKMPATRHILSLLAWATALICACPLRGHSQDNTEEQKIFRILHFFEYRENDHEDLVKQGKKLFPLYLRILSDKTGTQDWHETGVVRVLSILAEVDDDRSIFLEPALAHLNERRWEARYRAVVLLGQIGSVKEAPPLVALLNDPKSGVAGAAATAVGKIGGDRELLAMTIWLKNADLRKDPETVKDVRAAIEQITKRLEKKKKQ